MIKFIQTFNIFIFIIFFQTKTAIQSLSDFNSQNFNSKGLAEKILPQKYRTLSDIYYAIKHSNQRENVVVLLQCFDTIKKSYKLPSEIQEKIIFMTIGRFFSFSKIEIRPDFPNLYLDKFQYFTVTNMETYPGKISQNCAIIIKPKDVGSFFDLTNELTINYIESTFDLNSFIFNFFQHNDFFEIKLKDQNVILEVDDCNKWDTVVKNLDQNFIATPEEINPLKKKIKFAQEHTSNYITFSPDEEILFKEKKKPFLLLLVNAETFENFRNKVKKYAVNINNNIHSPENYACKIGSTITIIHLISKNKIQKTFAKEIALKACVSENEILAVEVIDEHIYSNDYANYHFNNKPNPTYHIIKIYDLLTQKLLNIINLPLPEQYTFEKYDFSLFGIQGNNVYIYNKKEQVYIQIEFNTDQEYTGNQLCDTKMPLTITPHKNDSQNHTNQNQVIIQQENNLNQYNQMPPVITSNEQNQEDIQPNNPEIQKNDSINPVTTEPVNRSKKSIIGYIKQRIKYIASISLACVVFFIFRQSFWRFFAHHHLQ